MNPNGWQKSKFLSYPAHQWRRSPLSHSIFELEESPSGALRMGSHASGNGSKISNEDGFKLLLIVHFEWPTNSYP